MFIMTIRVYMNLRLCRILLRISLQNPYGGWQLYELLWVQLRVQHPDKQCMVSSEFYLKAVKVCQWRKFYDSTSDNSSRKSNEMENLWVWRYHLHYCYYTAICIRREETLHPLVQVQMLLTTELFSVIVWLRIFIDKNYFWPPFTIT